MNEHNQFSKIFIYLINVNKSQYTHYYYNSEDAICLKKLFVSQ
jgi:hypothetical protein